MRTFDKIGIGSRQSLLCPGELQEAASLVVRVRVQHLPEEAHVRGLRTQIGRVLSMTLQQRQIDLQ